MTKKDFFLTPQKTSGLFWGLLIIATITIFSSCEQETSALGSDLLPDNSLEYKYDTSLTFLASVYEENAYITSNQTYYSIGLIEDDQFGTMQSEYLGQFVPPSFPDTAILSKTIDSALLYIAIDSLYGNPMEELSFNVYKLIEDINDNGDYYSNTDISSFYSESEPIGSPGRFSGDSLYVIPLESSFYNNLLTAEDSLYDNIVDFLSVHKGVAITPTVTSGIGGMISANIGSDDTKLVLHYNDSLTHTYKFSTGHRFAKYTTDYSGAQANNFLVNDTSENDDLMYLQGLYGLKSQLTFTNIDNWFEQDSSYSIINAELILPVYEDNNFEKLFPPNNLYIRYQMEDSTYRFIKDYYDYIEQRGIFDGSYDSENGYYRFIIPKHLMQLVNRNLENYELDFSIVNKTAYPHRVILQTGDKIKLNVTYTKH